MPVDISRLNTLIAEVAHARRAVQRAQETAAEGQGTVNRRSDRLRRAEVELATYVSELANEIPDEP